MPTNSFSDKTFATHVLLENRMIRQVPSTGISVKYEEKGRSSCKRKNDAKIKNSPRLERCLLDIGSRLNRKNATSDPANNSHARVGSM